MMLKEVGSAVSNDITLISIALLLNPRLPKPTFLCLRRMLTRCDPQHRFDLLCQRDGGTINYIFILFDEGDYETGRWMLSGTLDLSAQPSGISMVSMWEPPTTTKISNCKMGHGVGVAVRLNLGWAGGGAPPFHPHNPEKPPPNR